MEVLEDGGISAYEGRHERPGYNRLVEMVRRGEVDRVVVYNVDRLHRSTAQLLEYLAASREHSVITDAVQGQGLDPSSADTRMMATMLSSVSEAESARKSERIVRQKRQAAEQGVFTTGGRYRPFGYNWDGTVREPEAEALRSAASRLLAGESLNRIVKDMDAAGVTSTTGIRMEHQRLRRILRNPRCAAIATYRGEELGPGQWEAILPVDQWREVVALLDNPERVTNHVGGRPQHLLSSIAVCSLCGDTVRANSFKDRRTGERRVRYTCRNWGDGQRHTSRRASDLDPYVTAVVVRTLAATDLGAYLDTRGSADDGATAVLAARKRDLTDRMADLEHQLATASGAAVSVVMRAVTRLGQELDEVTAKLAQAATMEDVSAVTPLVGAEDVLDTWESLDLDQQRAIVRECFTVSLAPVPPGPWPFDPDLVDIQVRL